MKKLVAILFLFTIGFNLSAQETNYDSHTLFSPLFYNTNGNEYRSASGVPGPKYWQNSVDYDIKAELDDTNHTITGKVVIHYTNNSPDDLDFLWLQLDQNLFKPDSRGQQIISGKSRYGNRGEKINGGYTISNVNTSSDFDYIIEDTRMQIRLKKPLAKNGGKIDISMDFSFLIPVNGSDRMGHLATKNGEIYTVAQWFPRMAVYDDILGWNTKPYWGAGEFYCEYGGINMELTAPANHFVLASGDLMNPKDVLSKKQLKRWNKAKKSGEIIEVVKENEVADIAKKSTNKTKTWKYTIKNTRDAAWASSKAFVVDATKINLPSGKSCMAISAQPVESNTADSYGRGCEYVKASIEHYSEMWYEYPYPLAINIASNQGGMEYPGIVFCGWKAKNASCWGVIDHEFGHTWFPMIVGSNERSFGWMDEGFNTFINEISAREFNNGEYETSQALPVAQFAKVYADDSNEFIMLAPDVMKEKNIGLQLYWKPGMGLKLLREEIIGEDRFDYAFRHYIKSWAFKHPTPEDFYRSIENAAGEDLSWFWRGWFINNYTLDQAITKVEKTDGGYEVTIENKNQMAMPVYITAETSGGKTITHNQNVDIWMRNSEFSFFIPTNETVVKVTLDADNKLPDVNRDNNVWQGK